MQMVLRGMNYIICLVYLDDLIVFGHTLDEQLCNLERVLERVRMAKLKLKPSKCKVVKQEL